MTKNKLPGPKYGVPSTVGYERNDPRFFRAPAYSMRQRLSVAANESGSQVPGPKYNVSNVTRHGLVNKSKGALLASRFVQPTARIPGPATYNTVPCTSIIKPSMPMYSMG